MRTYGEISLIPQGKVGGREKPERWRIKGDRHVITILKRVFSGVETWHISEVEMTNTPENCRDLLWFLERYPMEVRDHAIMQASASQHVATLARLDEITAPNYQPQEYPLAIPLRDYQKVAVDLYLARGSLLLGDDIGIGKTAVAIGSFADPATLPAVVVTLAHLPRQWEKEIHRFMPSLTTHVIKKGTPYPLPEINGRGPDVIITNYHKLAGWSGIFAQYCKSVVYDEVQELRRDTSYKYAGALEVSGACDYRLGLSATPIFNYGGEYYNINETISPGVLGTSAEFGRAWGGYAISDPKAFGSYLRENHIMLRRTRQEVGREMPALSKVIHTVDSDSRELHRVKDSATELARIILDRAESTSQDRYTASGQFDMLMRQVTGLSKAPYVADFVKILLEAGEKIVLYGWHREVYSIWASRLKDYHPIWYTGSESAIKKETGVQKFIDGESQLLMISLRAGAGLDGLQYSGCRTVVFGELDWSPGVHEQNIGRVCRDGQPEPVVVYFLVADDGADPIMVDTLGLKQEQVDGIRNPDDIFPERKAGPVKDIAGMARAYLDGKI